MGGSIKASHAIFECTHDTSSTTPTTPIEELLSVLELDATLVTAAVARLS
jgi:hypothetical protein